MFDCEGLVFNLKSLKYMPEKKNYESSWLEWGTLLSTKSTFSDFIVNTLKNMADIMT